MLERPASTQRREQTPWWALPKHSLTLLCSPSPLQDRDSTEEDVPKLLVPPEISPEVAKALAEVTGRTAEQLEELGEPQEEGGIEPEVEQGNSQLEEEVEELGTEEQEEEQECFEEPNELGDPAVMRAVRSKPTLEVMCERRGGVLLLPLHPHTCGSCPTEGTEGGR